MQRGCKSAFCHLINIKNLTNNDFLTKPQVKVNVVKVWPRLKTIINMNINYTLT